MRFVQQMSAENQYEIQTYRHVPKFVPAGQSTQMIIGATPESDYQILHVAESLYKKIDLKRVFYSAFIPVNEDKNLPSVKEQRPPLLREHRLYQADWLLRYYHFEAGELWMKKILILMHILIRNAFGRKASRRISDRDKLRGI